jgi:hypothetical protein
MPICHTHITRCDGRPGAGRDVPAERCLGRPRSPLIRGDASCELQDELRVGQDRVDARHGSCDPGNARPSRQDDLA